METFGGGGGSAAAASAAADADAGSSSFACAYPFDVVPPVDIPGPVPLEPSTKIVAVLGHAAVTTLAVAALRHHVTAKGKKFVYRMGDITVAPLAGLQPGDGWTQEGGPTTFMFRQGDDTVFTLLTPITVFVASQGTFATEYRNSLLRFRVFQVDMGKLASEGLLDGSHFVQNPPMGHGASLMYLLKDTTQPTAPLTHFQEELDSRKTDDVQLTDTWTMIGVSPSRRVTFYTSDTNLENKMDIPLEVFSSPAWHQTFTGAIFAPDASAKAVLSQLDAAEKARKEKKAAAAASAAAAGATAGAAAGAAAAPVDVDADFS